MQRTDAEKMLLQSPNGTFLIRFSEGDPGGISVAWVNGELECATCISIVCVCVCVVKMVIRWVRTDKYSASPPGTSTSWESVPLPTGL